LLLLLFGEHREYSLTLIFVRHTLKKMAVMLNILAADEPVHANLPWAQETPGCTDCPKILLSCKA
jgi:hypothetical protein